MWPSYPSTSMCSEAVAFDALGIFVSFRGSFRSLRRPGVAGHDVALARDEAVLEIEDPVGDDLAAAGELAGHGGGGALGVGDAVLHRRLDAGGGAVLEHAAENLLAVTHPRGARRVVAIDLNELDVIGIEIEQGVDVPLPVRTRELADVELRGGLHGHDVLLRLFRGPCRDYDRP